MKRIFYESLKIGKDRLKKIYQLFGNFEKAKIKRKKKWQRSTKII